MKILGLVVLLLSLISCGGGTLDWTLDNSSVPDEETEAIGQDAQIAQGEQGPQGEPGASGADGSVGPQGAEGEAGENGKSFSIPSGVWLDKVNRIFYYVSEEGLIIQSEDTSGAHNSAGAFNGKGKGNKAFVGFNGYNGQFVSSFESMEIVARKDRGGSFFYLNIQVDCDGNGVWDANDGIVVVDSDTLAGFDLTDNFDTIVITPDLPVFKIVGGPKATCGNLPEHLGVVGAALSDLPAEATFFRGSTGDGGMPRDSEMAVIMLVMGDSNNEKQRTMTIESVLINDDEYLF
jgi:hypothetical protein